jgi:hypothetical protein
MSTSLPGSHGLFAMAQAASSENADPSVPSKILVPLYTDGSSLKRGRTTRTGRTFYSVPCNEDLEGIVVKPKVSLAIEGTLNLLPSVLP